MTMTMIIMYLDEYSTSLSLLHAVVVVRKKDSALKESLLCGSAVAASGFDLCLYTHKPSYEKVNAIRVRKCSLLVGTSAGF